MIKIPWDLQISKYQDLLFKPNRDWQTVAGHRLLSQRIFIRLKVHRGSWVFDEDGSLGSHLDLALQANQINAIDEIPLFVSEALEPMNEEIDINDIRVEASETDSRALNLVIEYRPILSSGLADVPILENEFLRTIIPVTL